MAGYSGTPLARKLGIQAGHRVALVNAPPAFEEQLDGLPPDVDLLRDLRGGGGLDVVVCFSSDRLGLIRKFPSLLRRLRPAGGLWVAWPKRSSGVATNLTEDVVRGVGLDAGLVDNKVCAIDSTWSGLRFVIRLADRPL